MRVIARAGPWFQQILWIPPPEVSFQGGETDNVLGTTGLPLGGDDVFQNRDRESGLGQGDDHRVLDEVLVASREPGWFGAVRAG